MWDSAAASMFFTETGVDKLLSDPASLTIEALLRENSIIQDTQAQSPKLLEL
jgi:hypothetical protein